jgi:hypothetical protein
MAGCFQTQIKSWERNDVDGTPRNRDNQSFNNRNARGAATVNESGSHATGREETSYLILLDRAALRMFNNLIIPAGRSRVP